MNQEEATEIIREAYKREINFFDTANGYSKGESERVLGNALKEIGAKRERIVIAAKVTMPCFDHISKKPSWENLSIPQW